MSLLELLGDDGHGGVRIQEAVADDLPDQFVGAAVIGLGTAGEILETEGTLGEEAGAQLEVTLFGVVVLAGGSGGAQAAAFALQEHGEFEGDGVVGGDAQGTALADEGGLVAGEGEHSGEEDG